jgi:hypothetical protein
LARFKTVAAGTCGICDGELIPRNFEAALLCGAGENSEIIRLDVCNEGIAGVIRRQQAEIRYGASLYLQGLLSSCGLKLFRCDLTIGTVSQAPTNAGCGNKLPIQSISPKASDE